MPVNYIIRQAIYLRSTIVARSRSHFCHVKATMRSV